MVSYKLTIKEKNKTAVERIIPLNTPEDVVSFGNVVLNLRSGETEPVITLEYLSEDEVYKMNAKNKNKENLPTETDEFGNVRVVNPPKKDTEVDANNVVAITETFGREDEEGNPTGTKLSAGEQAKKQANLEKQEKAKSKEANKAAK